MRITTRLIIIFCFWLHPGIVLGVTGSKVLPEVQLNQAVHFQSSEGGDLLVTPGTYQVIATKDALRLIPTSSSEEHKDSKLVQANSSGHELHLETPELLSIVGEDGNTHHLIYLMPEGEARVALGYYSEIRTRAGTSIWAKKINRSQIYRQFTSIPALQARVGASVRNVTQLSAEMTRLRAKMLKLQEAIYDENIEDAKTQYEGAKEQFKLALKILQKHQERQTQAVKKFTQ